MKLQLHRVVRPRTRDQIEEEAWRAREFVDLRPFESVDVLNLFERVLPKMIPGFHIRVEEDAKLGGAEAVTHATKPIITLSERTHRGLELRRPRPQSTAIHELGHLLMHTGNFGYAFVTKYNPLIDPEKQADIFSEAFQMPECAFRRVSSVEEAMRVFGVSRDAATYRAKSLEMWGLRHDRRRMSRKRKGYGIDRTP